MKRIYIYLSVKCNIHAHVEINFKHLNTYVQDDILQDNEQLACLAAAWREMEVSTQ